MTRWGFYLADRYTTAGLSPGYDSEAALDGGRQGLADTITIT